MNNKKGEKALKLLFVCVACAGIVLAVVLAFEQYELLK
jgi:hypothetical protein